MKIKHIKPYLGCPNSAADDISVIVVSLSGRIFWEGTTKEFRENTHLIPIATISTPLEEWDVIMIERRPDDTIPIYNRGYRITVD